LGFKVLFPFKLLQRKLSTEPVKLSSLYPVYYVLRLFQ
jgi:hypothetical protein